MTIENYIITKDYNGERPRVTMPNPEFLRFLGEEKFRALISRHYDLLIESDIKHLFPENKEALNAAKSRSADFFIQIMGGPEYYKQNRGEPMMKKRHMPFAIDMKARIVWLECYRLALLEIDDLPDHLAVSYWNYLDNFSLWMMNS